MRTAASKRHKAHTHGRHLSLDFIACNNSSANFHICTFHEFKIYIVLPLIHSLAVRPCQAEWLQYNKCTEVNAVENKSLGKVIVRFASE